MNLTFTGHSFDVTPALRDFTTGKLDKLNRHFEKISSISVTFAVEKLSQIVEANIHLAGAEIHARSESEDMYAAVDLLIDKLDRQLIKHKEQMTDHRDF